MDHLEYKDIVNKAYKTYYDKFKKMVKQDLTGDGWFLLVNDFPFKEGNNLMFTAGENIEKWLSKNLISLYGKTNFIVGRVRKKGPVITLLDFQEGDYLKKVTESGLRKELKEYFQGTGVSVRIFKSVKVSEAEPEKEDSIASDPAETPITQPETVQKSLIPEMYTPTDKRAFILEIGDEISDRALAAGLSEIPEYKKKWINLNRLVRLGNTNGAMEAVEKMLIFLRDNEPEEAP
ncbi:hypothetical protein N9933_02400 [bacterium]|nr:hypothetical protein [bacterium]